jgi:hypothetical protein
MQNYPDNIRTTNDSTLNELSEVLVILNLFDKMQVDEFLNILKKILSMRFQKTIKSSKNLQKYIKII